MPRSTARSDENKRNKERVFTGVPLLAAVSSEVPLKGGSSQIILGDIGPKIDQITGNGGKAAPGLRQVLDLSGAL